MSNQELSRGQQRDQMPHDQMPRTSGGRPLEQHRPDLPGRSQPSAPISTLPDFTISDASGNTDQRIHDEIIFLLTSDRLLDPRQFEVHVRDGIVTLRGIIAQPQILPVIKNRIALISDIKGVRNQLQVRQPNPT